MRADQPNEKRMRGRKVLAFLTSMFIFTSFFVLALFVAPNVLTVNGPILLILIFMNATVFICFNTLDKWLQTKYFKGGRE
jgi:hypothetical protein